MCAPTLAASSFPLRKRERQGGRTTFNGTDGDSRAKLPGMLREMNVVTMMIIISMYVHIYISTLNIDL